MLNNEGSKSNHPIQSHANDRKEQNKKVENNLKIN